MHVGFRDLVREPSLASGRSEPKGGATTWTQGSARSAAPTPAAHAQLARRTALLRRRLREDPASSDAREGSRNSRLHEGRNETTFFLGGGGSGSTPSAHRPAEQCYGLQRRAAGEGVSPTSNAAGWSLVSLA
ncbi:hypothetical protein MDA_GLEAN10005980 [Myotis davidii]|uniref:Uncharacterized protein n=1 Tax=Myotis davidii TaxID=225400 RepID=L5MH94_MYODS|nr:hypothetical protein MDA_GLEAN10005980 [Myotis davidii]